jgi:hypothetical protein
MEQLERDIMEALGYPDPYLLVYPMPIATTASRQLCPSTLLTSERTPNPTGRCSNG